MLTPVTPRATVRRRRGRGRQVRRSDPVAPAAGEPTLPRPVSPRPRGIGGRGAGRGGDGADGRARGVAGTAEKAGRAGSVRERGNGMITVPAMRLKQFGVTLYQAILGARDVDRLVRFEVLSYDAGGAPPPPPRTGEGGKGRKPKPSPGDRGLLERRIGESSEAYQRPVIRKKIAELVDYYVQCADTGNLPAVPGAVLLVSDRRLEFTPTSSHRVLGVLQIPTEGGVLRALD